MQNPVGYDALGATSDGVKHDKYGGNVNEPLHDGKAVGLNMRAEPGKSPTLDKPVNVYIGENLAPLGQMADECPKNLTVDGDGEQPAARAERRPTRRGDVIWFEEPPIDTSEAALAAAKKAVEAGATLVFSGKSLPLLALYAGHARTRLAPRPDVVFEDFEHGYDKWKVEGEAFGREPAKGTFPNQQPVTGFKGKGLANSYIGDDNATGKLVSQPFTIKRNFIRFLIGGGAASHHADSPDRQRQGRAGVQRAQRGTAAARAVGRPRVCRQEGPHRNRR